MVFGTREFVDGNHFLHWLAPLESARFTVSLLADFGSVVRDAISRLPSLPVTMMLKFFAGVTLVSHGRMYSRSMVSFRSYRNESEKLMPRRTWHFCAAGGNVGPIDELQNRVVVLTDCQPYPVLRFDSSEMMSERALFMAMVFPFCASVTMRRLQRPAVGGKGRATNGSRANQYSECR